MRVRTMASGGARPDGGRGLRSAPAIVVFSSDLGWMALVTRGGTLRHLSFGHQSAEAAQRALPDRLTGSAQPVRGAGALVRRLQAYASGAFDEFRDVEVELGPVSDFQRRVIERCRRIPYGETLTYGELATQAGYARAARAVGNCMAANPIPLIIPCHRVVGSGGGLGGYSAVGGVEMKRRLLKLEAGRSASSSSVIQ